MRVASKRSYYRYGRLEREISFQSALTGFIGLTTVIFLFGSLALFVLGNGVWKMISDAESCTMENCISRAGNCGINICTLNGECLSLPDIDGCVEEGVNVTAQTSEARYGFDSICYTTIGLCQSQSSPSIYQSQISESSEPSSFSSDANNEPDTSLLTVKTSKVIFRYIAEWNANLTGSKLESNIGFPYEICDECETYRYFSIIYDGDTKLGKAKIDQSGNLKLYWYDEENGYFSDTFHCNCFFETIDLTYL